ncbi:MAG: hypothetical protein R3F39_22495 [Myxococcota bacterium]
MSALRPGPPRPRGALAAVLGALALMSGAGCDNDGLGGLAPLRSPDRVAFAARAGEVLAQRCGTANCHGNAERPYALYAPLQRRQPEIGDYAKRPLTEAEIDANYVATLGFLDAERALDTTLLRRALAVGGAGSHGGGAVFEAPSDPECRALRDWIEGGP